MHASGPEELVGWLAGFGILAVVVWRAVQAFGTGAPPPDPWDEATAARLEDADLKPVCTRCLCPHEETDWFCPNCGQAASATTNWMPYLYYLSLGDVLRQGTTGDFPPRWVCKAGYRVTSLIAYGGVIGSVYGPISSRHVEVELAALVLVFTLVGIYWRQLANNLQRLRSDHAVRTADADAAVPLGSPN
jgi:hypothetical protein